MTKPNKEMQMHETDMTLPMPHKQRRKIVAQGVEAGNSQKHDGSAVP